jgi:hypothetical protein
MGNEFNLIDCKRGVVVDSLGELFDWAIKHAVSLHIADLLLTIKFINSLLNIKYIKLILAKSFL